MDFYTADWLNVNTTGELTLGGAASLPSGDITGFGIFASQTSGSTIRIDTFQIAIPEPSTFMMVLLGGIFFVCGRRTRKSTP
ncbi:MAG: PEP-CTERM sorting domain-containing protein [Verrucomicrobia bacterium]|nr:PEP-CTERM sorting domain-containing protein [Verrucomicrobiota bacterium]MCH8514426.1 PEP-CTERM sorting domain-containing protein [Kiritimatiellia bacterium]